MTGIIERDGDRMMVTFRRSYDTTVEDLWDALTSPDRLARWFGARASFSPDRVELQWDDPDQWVRGAVLAYEPPRLLEYEWRFPGEDESVVRFELSPSASGAELVLTHRRLGPAGSGYGAAWHAYLDRLDGLYAGEDVDWFDRFAELRPAYT